MSYLALYRKWRPDTFDEVKGQDAIVRTLRNQIIHKRIGHAYLFCGTRGTGKTSIAKLFARAVNCENPRDGSPCNECPSCLAIKSQSSLNVKEIDAASNNGVDNVREIREEVQYTPTTGRYKVYIIDEVHMLSGPAFNALLKTLEEPPSYVIFILATTEKYKVPITILSRCQKYDFKRISTDVISDHLTELVGKEGIPAQDRALRYIARAADGSMRDALSLLDQCISFYLDQELTYDKVLTVLGTADTTVFSQLFRHILARDTSAVLSTIDQSIVEGRDLTQLLSDFLWYLRNLLILKDQEGNEDSLLMSADHISLLKEDAELAGTETLLRYIQVLSELSNQMRASSQKRVVMEVGFIRLCLPQMDTDSLALLERVRALEEEIARGIPAAAVNMSGGPAYASPQGAGSSHGQAGSDRENGSNGPMTGDQALTALEQKFPPAEAADLKQIAGSWRDVIAASASPMRNYLSKVRPIVSEDSKIIRLLTPPSDNLTKLFFESDHQRRLKELSDLVAQVSGKQIEFECISESQTAAASADYIDLSLIQSKIRMPIIEEE